MNKISVIFGLLWLATRVYAEPSGFEIINKSGVSERIVLTTNVSQISVVLRAEEKMFVKTLSDNSTPISIRMLVQDFDEERIDSQWTIFTIDESKKYLATYVNQASKTLDMKKSQEESDVVILTNETEISVVSKSSK